MRAFIYVKPTLAEMALHFRSHLRRALDDTPIRKGPVSLQFRFVWFRDPKESRALPQDEQQPMKQLTSLALDLTRGVLYQYDFQVVSVHATREYGNVDGIEIRC